MTRLSKRNLVVAAVAVVAAGGGGAAIAATQLDSPTARSDAIVSDAAKQLGIEPQALSDALKRAEKNQIDADVAAGRLTKEQGDALKAAIEAGNVPLVGFGPALGFGRHGIAGFALDLDAAAAYLGLERDALVGELRDGKSLADIAKAHGKAVDGLVGALVAAAKKHLDARVAAGTLTADQAKAIEANLDQRMTDLVEATPPHLGRLGLGGPSGVKLGFGVLGSLVSTATSYLGVSEDELRSELRDGKSLAEIAKAHGKTADGLVEALVSAAKKALDERVAAGALTRDQADTIESSLEPAVRSMVEGTFPEPGFGVRPWRHGGNGFLLPRLGSRSAGLALPGLGLA